MMKKAKGKTSQPAGLAKSPTGVPGLDEITFGGLPRGRPTLVCGGPGCGKTLLAMNFLVRGATRFGEPGVCISFEETAEELARNVASLGFDLAGLVRKKLLAIDSVFIERSLMEEAGAYDLEALFVRIGHAVDSIGAKRVVLDSVESLFAGLTDEAMVRSELRRLFRWLKQRGLTAVITGERGEGLLTRYGLEEYISDCVILLDQRVMESVVTRRLRIVKYRGSTHGTNEYPFLIDADGISVLPVTSLELKHSASEQRVSTGIPALDAMFRGGGLFRGSTVLISGGAGTGKTSMAAHFVDAGCSRGERCVYFSFEESADQVVRNMRSIGLRLGRWIDKGLLRFCASRPTTFGLETHLVQMHRVITEFDPSIVVVDPATALLHSGSENETRGMLLRLVDYLKGRQITALLTILAAVEEGEISDVAISSLIDTWVLLSELESGGERNRGLNILKARGLAHSNQVREFLITDRGVQLQDIYVGEGGMLAGSARAAEEAREAAAAQQLRHETEVRQLELARKKSVLESQMAALRQELAAQEQQMRHIDEQEELRATRVERVRGAIARSRAADTTPPGDGKRRGGRK